MVYKQNIATREKKKISLRNIKKDLKLLENVQKDSQTSNNRYIDQFLKFSEGKRMCIALENTFLKEG